MYENKKLGFLFVLPFVLGVVLFKLFPFVMSFALSFTQYDIIDPPQWIGLQNYRELFGDDPLFRKSLGVTLLFAVLAVPLRVGFALLVAHVLNYKLRGIHFFRSAFYLPSILGGSIAVAVLWRFIFSKYGLVNLVLVKLGFEPVAWLADTCDYRVFVDQSATEIVATVLGEHDLRLDLRTLRVTRGNKVIALQPREYRLLEYLMRHAGQVVTRTMLLENVWDYHFDPQTNVIDVHISRLRSKIDKGQDKPLLHTIRGAGYMIRDGIR